MKKLLKIVAAILLVLVIIAFFSTSRIKRTSYYAEDYYRQSLARLDSARARTFIDTASVWAGFSKVSITPELSSGEDNWKEGKFSHVPLAGFGSRKGKPAKGIHDSIFVRAVALRAGSRTVVLVGSDLLIMPPFVTDSVVKKLSDRGVSREQLFFSATHTHSSLGGWGPGFVGEQFAGKQNSGIEKWLAQQISKAIVLALDDIRPARAGSGHFNARTYTGNRASGNSGTRNNDFSFIQLEQNNGRKAVLGSFSAHSTTMGDENMEVSADYPGYWVRKTENGLADIAVFLAGATGSQSPKGEGNGFEKPRQIGEALADSLATHLPSVILKDRTEFAYVSFKMNLPGYHIRISPKVNLSSFLSRRLMPQSDNVYLQAIRIGKMVWITTPCDFSGEYALQLKNSLAAEGFDSNVTSFNGSYIGYIVPPRYFYLKEYEPMLMGWYGPEMGDYTMELIRQLARMVTGSDNI